MDSDEDDEGPQNEPGTSSTLNLLNRCFFIIKDQQQVLKDQQPDRKDQLQVLILVMKTVSTAMSAVHSALSRSLRSNQR